MRDKLQCKPKHTGIIASVVTFVCLIQSVVRPLYVDVDNYFISLVANKMFAGEAQDGYILHLHPFLCKLLEGVLFINESADCVLLVSALMLSVAIWAIAYVIASNAKSYYELLVYIVVFFAVVFVGDLFHDNYTRWAAFMTAAGVMVLLWDVHGKRYHRKHQVLAACLLSFGLMWRDEAFLVFIPFVGLDIVITFLKTAKEERSQLVKQLGKIVAVPVMCVVFLGMVDCVVRQSEPYKEAILYDDARVKVVDYAMKDWEELEDVPEGISQNDYESAIKWILLDTERMDAEYLLRINDAGEKKEFETSLKGVIGMQKRMLSVFLDSRYFHYLGILLILLFLIGLCRNYSVFRKIETILLFVGTDIIFLFFAYVGRAIDRGYIPAIYALLSTLVMLLLTENEEDKTRNIGMCLVVVLSVLAIGREVAFGNWSVGQSIFKAKTDAENVYATWCVDERLFIWDSNSYMLGPVRVFSEQGKLIPKEVLRHHMVAGSWNYGQVYFEQYLESIDAKNPMVALLERESTLYVAEDGEEVLKYLQEHVEENAIVEFAGEIYGNLVWRFSVAD